MTDFVYVSGVNGFLAANIDWLLDDIQAILIDDDIYKPDDDTHSTLIDIPAKARLKTTKLTGRSINGRWAKANAALFENVTGSNAGAVAIVKMREDSKQLPVLVAYIDSIEGLPVKPNGSGIRVGWSDNGIFSVGKN